MKRRAIAFVSVVTAGALLVPAASAQGAERVIARPFNAYQTTSVTISRGEALTFLNLDGVPVLSAPHDVTSLQTRTRCVRRDRRGRCRKRVSERLFKSKTFVGPAENPVVGADKLKSGSYGFFCTIHPFMRGTLRVG